MIKLDWNKVWVEFNTWFDVESAPDDWMEPDWKDQMKAIEHIINKHIEETRRNEQCELA